MKFLICYFSGTGNTKKIVHKYKDELELKNIKTELRKIEDDMNFDINEYDVLIIAYPVHAFNAPSIVLNFAKKLPKTEDKKRLVIVSTSGEPLALNNISSQKLVKILKKKNYVLTNEYHYVMPYNIIFRHSDNMAYKMWTTAKNVIPIDCKEIIEGKESKLKKNVMGGMLRWVFQIEHVAGRINVKHYKINEKCIKCQKCIRECPTKNISIEDGKIKFGKNCLMCMRCSFHCPTNAIKIGLFEKWKVNGEYNFDNYNENEKQTHKKYCKKSYNKYFKRCEEKINKDKEAM